MTAVIVFQFMDHLTSKITVADTRQWLIYTVINLNDLLVQVIMHIIPAARSNGAHLRCRWWPCKRGGRRAVTWKIFHRDLDVMGCSLDLFDLPTRLSEPFYRLRRREYLATILRRLLEEVLQCMGIGRQPLLLVGDPCLVNQGASLVSKEYSIQSQDDIRATAVLLITKRA